MAANPETSAEPNLFKSINAIKSLFSAFAFNFHPFMHTKPAWTFISARNPSSLMAISYRLVY
jgi:hypothetical protein